MALLRRIIGSRFVRYGFLVLVVAGGVYAIAEDWHKIGPALARIGVPMAFASLALCLLASVAAMWTWRVLLAGLGSPLSFSAAARILFVGQLGKYLPGSVWPVIAQMEMAARYNVPRARTASAGLINMPVSVLSAMLVAIVTLPFTGGSTSYLWFLTATPLLLACLHPKVLNYLLGVMFKLTKRPPLEQPLTGRVIAKSVGWSFLSFLLYGAALYLLAIRVGLPARDYPLAAGAFAFAWAIGFIIILAPAGAGFREVLLAAILAHPAGPPTAAAAGAVTIVSRLVTIASDFIVAGLATANRNGRATAIADGDDAEEPVSVPGPLDRAPASDSASPAPHR